MTQPSRIIDSSKRFIRAPFGSALVGGLVVGLRQRGEPGSDRRSPG